MAKLLELLVCSLFVKKFRNVKTFEVGEFRGSNLQSTIDSNDDYIRCSQFYAIMLTFFAINLPLPFA